MTEQENLIKLLNSGNFTIAYHDNQEGCIYEGRIGNYDEVPEDGEVVCFYSCDDDSYLPSVVDWLVKALGGKALSI